VPLRKEKPLTLELATPVLNGCADEIGPYAHEVVADYLRETDAHAMPSDVLPDLEQDLDSAYEAWGMADDGTAEKRAALVRVASRAVACLALDELARGEAAAEKIHGRLDPLGFLKVRRARG
jgi:hypothetical protein